MTGFQVQRSGHTAPDRYPNLFRATRDLAYALNSHEPRVLSFGCSTGEEASTLAQKYFPDSTIVGLDTNSDAVGHAIKHHAVDGRVSFDYSTPETVRSYGPYGVIFALGVLCRWPESKNVDDLSDLFQFRDFERMIDILDQNLLSGGILVLNGSNYHFLDTAASNRYDTVLAPAVMNNGEVHRFDRFGRKCVGHNGSDSIYVKREKASSNSTRNVRNRRILDAQGTLSGTISVGDY